MKKTYFSGLAFTLAAASAPTFAFGQYQYGQAQPLYGGSSFAPSVASPYQLVGVQGDQLLQQAPQHTHVPLPATNGVAPQPIYQDPAPAPMGHHNIAPQPMPQPMAQPMQQGGAPGCSSCASGSGGVVQGYDVGNYSVGAYGNGSYAGGCASGSCGPVGMGGGLGGWGMGYGSGFGCGTGMGCRPAPKWFAGAGGLFMAQQDARVVNLANIAGVPNLATNEARVGTAPGVEGMLGRYFNCGRNAIVGSYWGLFPDANQSITTDVGLRSSLPFGQPNALGTAGVDYPSGAGIVDVYDIYNHDLVTPVTAQRVRRDTDFHNGEINILGWGLGGAAVAPSCGGCGFFGGPNAGLMPASCSRIRLGWLAGVRWLRFRDDFEYATSQTDDMFGSTADDFYYTNGTINDLVGFQFGGNLSYAVTQRISMYSGAKFGVMGNHMQYDTRLGTRNAVAMTNSPNPAYDNVGYDFMSTRDDVAFLGEGDVGLNVRIKCGWAAYVGYRAIGVSGVATAIGQIPYKFDDVPLIQRINNADSLMLHGVYFGGTYNF